MLKMLLLVARVSQLTIVYEYLISQLHYVNYQAVLLSQERGYLPGLDLEIGENS